MADGGCLSSDGSWTAFCQWGAPAPSWPLMLTRLTQGDTDGSWGSHSPWKFTGNLQDTHKFRRELFERFGIFTYRGGLRSLRAPAGSRTGELSPHLCSAGRL